VEELDRSSDRHLLQRFREGDRDAFTMLYRAHYPAVFRFAFYMTGDRARAGEVVQDAFVWLVHHPEEFDPERGGLAAFLGGVARKFLHRQRQHDRRWLPFDHNAASLLEQGGERKLPREIAEAEDSADLWKAVSSLPERYREVVVLCDLEEKSNEEAAGLIGCAVGTVWSRLHRAHELLARKLRGKKEKLRCST
jgi:RNA polymerase sigma-70 factor (ECF subfamily)